jgi:hypothetical protein
MAILYVKKARRDKKYPVTYAFENGTRINKIITRDQLIMDSHKYEIRGIYIDPLEWPENMDPEDVEEYAH